MPTTPTAAAPASSRAPWCWPAMAPSVARWMWRRVRHCSCSAMARPCSPTCCPAPAMWSSWMRAC
ncbi:hypothetical protein ABB31_11270 [Stenotrophomonas pavanii]|nr:hypothetical protein ABB31_11270 [Stenotrophomonas pavanii]